MKTSWLIWLGVLVVAIWPTMTFSGYHLFQLTMVVVYAIAVLGLAILTGVNGQISLGHGAFYAIGAYTTAILMASWDVPYWVTIPISAVVCAITGFLLGLPALRLGGHYLALTTFALAVAVPQILKHKLFEDWTGGVQGLADRPRRGLGQGHRAFIPQAWFSRACNCSASCACCKASMTSLRSPSKIDINLYSVRLMR